MGTETLSLKERLQQELDEARAELDRLEKQRLEGKGDYGLGTGDPSIYEWEMCLAMKQGVENRIKLLEEALQKAEEGSYGQCEICGQPIDPARLAVLPTPSVVSAAPKSDSAVTDVQSAGASAPAVFSFSAYALPTFANHGLFS